MSGKVPLAASSPNAPQWRQRRAVIVPQAPANPPPVLSWGEWLRGRDGSSFLISFLVHATLLAMLAVPISQGLLQGPELTPLIQVIDAEVEGDPLGDFIDAPVLITQTALGSEQFDATQFESQATDFPIATNAALSDSAGTAGSEDGNSSADLAGAVGGYLLREPGNAVKAGRFTAFSRPIIEVGFGKNKREEFGEPGDAPLDRQDYFIVIHFRVDERRKTYPIGDLIGSVVGTDGYTQKVPNGLYVLDDQGLPQEIKKGKPIKVTDGVVQLLMRVKGGASGVRDNIYLKSKMLREEQNLQLIFQSRGAGKDE